MEEAPANISDVSVLPLSHPILLRCVWTREPLLNSSFQQIILEVVTNEFTAGIRLNGFNFKGKLSFDKITEIEKTRIEFRFESEWKKPGEWGG